MTLARPDTQGTLLEVAPRFTIDCNARARNAYGAAAQEIVCAALQLDPIPIDGSKSVCFDAKAQDQDVYYEIKSVKRTGKVVVYDWRMTKEAGAGVCVRYAILCHGVKGCRDGDRLFHEFAQHGVEILVCQLETVHRIARTQTLNIMKVTQPENTRIGYERRGYRDGYRNVPVRRLRDRTMRATNRDFLLYGVSFSVPLYIEL